MAIFLNEIENILAQQSQYTWVSNGRFKGGYITRHYANLDAHIFAFQLELSQSAYMNTEMTQFDAEKALPVQQLIQQMMHKGLDSIEQL